MLNSNANDSLVALLVTLAFLALVASARARGAAGAGGRRPSSRRSRSRRCWRAIPTAALRDAIAFSLAFAAVLVLAFALVVPDGGVRELWDRTVGFQLGRDSPFSIWGQEDWLGWLQDLVKAGGRAARRRRRASSRGARRALQVAALGAAVLIAAAARALALVLPVHRVVAAAGADRAARRGSA